MVRGDRDFVVYDAKTGDDLTHSVLTQIIVEQENRVGGQTLLPVPFLRQLIRFYDDSIGRMVPGYLQFSLENLVKEQEKFRAQFANCLLQSGGSLRGLPGAGAQEHGHVRAGALAVDPLRRQARRGQQSEKGAAEAQAGPDPNEISELKAQLANMQQKIDKLSRDRDEYGDPVSFSATSARSTNERCRSARVLLHRTRAPVAWA